MARPKRKRAPTDVLEAANKKTDEQFVAHYLQPQAAKSPWVSEWTHPRTSAKYSITLVSAGDLGDAALQACFRLVEETSRVDYENSTKGWDPSGKLAEMRSPELRYILVREGSDDASSIRGFTSLMPTYEEGEPVVYCYEIHLKPDLRGTGLGRLLMDFHVAVARNLSPPVRKVMLTCFVANARGLDFYRKLGFVKDPISPEPRRLRFGKTFTPDYVIMSRSVMPNAVGSE